MSIQQGASVSRVLLDRAICAAYRQQPCQVHLPDLPATGMQHMLLLHPLLGLSMPRQVLDNVSRQQQYYYLILSTVFSASALEQLCCVLQHPAAMRQQYLQLLKQHPLHRHGLQDIVHKLFVTLHGHVTTVVATGCQYDVSALYAVLLGCWFAGCFVQVLHDIHHFASDNCGLQHAWLHGKAAT